MKAINQVLFVIITLLALAACGQQEIHIDDSTSSEVTSGESDLFSHASGEYIYEPNSKFGLWKSNTMQVQSAEGSYTYSLRVRISKVDIKVAAKCEFPDGEVIVSETSSNAQFLQGQIQVLEQSNSLSTSADGTRDCEASIYETDLNDPQDLLVESGIMRHLRALGIDAILVKIGN